MIAGRDVPVDVTRLVREVAPDRVRVHALDVQALVRVLVRGVPAHVLAVPVHVQVLARVVDRDAVLVARGAALAIVLVAIAVAAVRVGLHVMVGAMGHVQEDVKVALLLVLMDV